MNPTTKTMDESQPTSLLSNLLDDYLSESEFCRELQIDTRTAKRWHSEGRGPAITKIGRRVFYHKDTIKKWLASLELRQPSGRAAGPSRLRTSRRRIAVGD